MDIDPDIEMEELRQELADEETRAQEETRARGASHEGFGLLNGVVMFRGVMVLALVVLFVLFFSQEKGISTVDIDSVDARIRGLEMRLDRIDDNAKNTIDRVDDLSASISKLDSIGRSHGVQLTKVSQDIKALDKRATFLPGKSVTPPETPTATFSGESAPFHQVRKGDNLYRISKRYGVSMDALRRINNLVTGQPIHVGQKLLLRP